MKQEKHHDRFFQFFNKKMLFFQARFLQKQKGGGLFGGKNVNVIFQFEKRPGRLFGRIRYLFMYAGERIYNPNSVRLIPVFLVFLTFFLSFCLFLLFCFVFLYFCGGFHRGKAAMKKAPRRKTKTRRSRRRRMRPTEWMQQKQQKRKTSRTEFGL